MIAIFVSGNGTNCENIIRHFSAHPSLRVSLVVSNRPDAYALVRAHRLGIPTVTISKATLNDTAAMRSLLQQYNIRYIVLAGFLLLMPASLVEAFHERIINIHPSLLPKYGGQGMYGHHVHQTVWEAREKETGITIHYVSPEYDRGPIIAQFRTPVLPTDTPDDIAQRVHKLEQQHFPEVIEATILARESADSPTSI